MSEQLVHALLSSASYPHPTATIRLLETHISWILLTGELAYKIKKPVNLGFLDFSTLARRQYYCAEELRLNSRFSASLYLDVVAITGSQEHPQIAASGRPEGEPPGASEILEYAVKMREFDQGELLDTLAEENSLSRDDIEALGEKLATFHLSQAARLEPGDQQLGTPESVSDAVQENFRQLLPITSAPPLRQCLEQLHLWSTRQLAQHQALLRQRREQGFVRECHGDLHLGNIARIKGEITFFDCLEFNEQFRWIDVQSELAFLLMDLDAKQRQAQGNRLLNHYLEYTGDYAGLALLQFYQVYRAVVRAKVMAFKAQDRQLAREPKESARLECSAYLHLAQSYLAPRKPFLALMHGISGTGKSTVSANLAGPCAAIRIRSDIERKRLFGLAPHAKSTDREKSELYSKQASSRTFARLQALAESLLELGYPVLVDATFIAAKWRQPFLQLAKQHQVPFVIIDCQASQATIVERLRLRQAKAKEASEAGVAVMRNQLASLDPFTAEEQQHLLTLNTEQPVDARALQHYLDQRR